MKQEFWIWLDPINLQRQQICWE